MILPSTYAMALLLAILSLVCWGSWANSYKLGRWRFELHYWDYALGALLAATVAAFTFGSLGFEFGGGDGFVFLDDLMRAAKRSIAYGLAAGAVFNLGNLLLVAATAVAGMSVAFPVGIGLALIVGVVCNYILKPAGNPTMLFSGAALVAAAVLLGVRAYRGLSLIRAEQVIKTGKSKTMKPKASWKGAVLALSSGLFLGTFSLLLDMSRATDIGLGPYAAGFVFIAGVFISTFAFNLFFMNLPVRGEPLEMLEYFRGTFRQHLFGIAGGIVWGIGTLSFLVASSATKNGGTLELNAAPAPLLGTAATTALGWGAPIVAALWGLLVWKEFQDAGSRERSFAAVALILFAAGLALVSIAPLYAR
jgi:glucose uptake protein